MSFGRRLRKVVSKFNCRRSSKPRTDTAPPAIHPSQSFQSRPYETPVGVGASEQAQPPPASWSKAQYVSTGSPIQAQPGPSQVHRLQAMGPDPESENRNYEGSSEGEQMLEENQRQTDLRRSPTNISTSSSDYSNHSISNSLSPATPVPWLGRTLMGSHLADTPPPTPPDSGSKGGLGPAWGESFEERRHAPSLPQLSFIQRNSSTSDELRTEEVFSQLRITDDGRGNIHGQFTPQDSPITGQTPHYIPTNTAFEASYSKPITHTIVHPQEVEQAADPLHREAHTSALHTRIQPMVAQEHLLAERYLETSTGEVTGLTDEQKQLDDCGEARRDESATDENGSQGLQTYDDGGGTGLKTTDDTTGLLARPKESELITEVKEFTAGPSLVPMVSS
ncbi:hypothetical protein B9Z19DRAFT_777471 [Tuber borchii]|uniref:Uncharacterized protein n=1 Tax=Tuber borchii TaxID=42251 RepID=A0A2T6ZWS7_TUBBO|nr:hypothetical protein B9Z19DRAFT_777471 [Tuber borchii]